MIARRILALGAAVASVAPALADDPQPAEAAAELFFARPFMAMSKAVSDGAVVYKGDKDLKDAERSVLSVAPSAADPCLFEAFFVEALPGGPRSGPTINGAYRATIDLRRNISVSLDAPANSPAKLTLRGARLFCSRSVVFNPDLRMTYGEFCQDEIASDSETSGARWKTAVDVLRKACRWEN